MLKPIELDMASASLLNSITYRRLIQLWHWESGIHWTCDLQIEKESSRKSMGKDERNMHHEKSSQWTALEEVHLSGKSSVSYQYTSIFVQCQQVICNSHAYAKCSALVCETRMQLPFSLYLSLSFFVYLCCSIFFLIIASTKGLE